MNKAEIIRPGVEAEDEINLLELLRVVVRNLPLIVKITTAAVILSAVTAFFCSIFLVFIREYLAKLSPEDSAMVSEMKGTLKDMLRLRRPVKLRD